MKITNIQNPQKFFEKLNSCKGSVKLSTAQGDLLNLKSTLCQLIALTNIFSNPAIGELEIFFSDAEDSRMMLEFLIRGDYSGE